MVLKQAYFQFSPEPDKAGQGQVIRQAKTFTQQPEHFYKQVFDSLEDYAVFTTDREGNISTWNKGAENLLGYSEGEVIGKNSRIFFTEKDLKMGSAEKELQVALMNGRAIDERFHVRKDKSEFWASGLMFPLFDEHKQ